MYIYIYIYIYVCIRYIIYTYICIHAVVNSETSEAKNQRLLPWCLGEMDEKWKESWGIPLRPYSYDFGNI